ncbi:pseudouridine synthase [Parathielavia appendiculata]|uniref:Pseudouridine synthase n=1 Tax=Parathielavia appendiculata TaxID=2587402 RepID=A0AAN6TXZ3_9PEZI|nr:pseudouridine synthase [Parathielavia appendiculata]
MADSNYQNWTKDQLVERVRELEQQLQRQHPPTDGSKPQHKQAKTKPSSPTTTPAPSQPGTATTRTAPAGTEKKEKKKKKSSSKLDPSKYSTRLVALKLAYLGKRYGGFEYQAGVAVPTVEEALWRALVKSCLIWPDDPDKVDFAPWDYSKCGRTDRGVSAEGEGEGEGERDGDRKPVWDPVADEINYPRVLNRLLPPDIRVLAWAPTLPENFSARFSCWERQYRYFFTQPAFTPLPATMDPDEKREAKEGWLDIDAMREAAKLFEGVHDFRNYCKVDGAKQITNFQRRVFEADIVEVEDTGSALPYLSQSDFRPEGLRGEGTYPKVYYFHVRGSAFLWHQIRHMVAILFMIGQGLEKPSIVTELLDVDRHPRKPNYTMADEVPLVLWDCIFPKVDEAMSKKAAVEVHNPDVEGNANMQDGIDWVWLGEDKPSHLHGPSGMVDQLWECWRERKMDELLANQLLDSVARKADLSRRLAESGSPEKPSSSQRVFEGGNTAKASGTYLPVLKKQLLATPEEANDKWAKSKGFASAEELAKTKNWRSVIKANKSAGALDSSADR